MAPTWDSPGWKSALHRLTASQQFVLKNSLRELLQALETSRDPLRDVVLQGWSPTKWAPPRRQATHGKWVEYRLGDQENRGRAIVCFDADDDIIYLVAKTAIHDHTTLRELVARFTPKPPNR